MKTCCICSQCKNENEFYRAHYNTTSLKYCKDCTRKKYNPNDISTVMEILKDADVPFIQEIWIEGYNKNIHSAIGFYLNKLNLISFRFLHYHG